MIDGIIYFGTTVATFIPYYYRITILSLTSASVRLYRRNDAFRVSISFYDRICIRSNRLKEYVADDVDVK